MPTKTLLQETQDLLIVGAGCSGLSLARELALRGYRGKVVLLDQRTAFSNDKTWSYWAKKESRWHQLAEHYWDSCEISLRGGHRQQCDFHAYDYCSLPADTFYQDACSLIDLGGYTVELGQTVQTIEAIDDPPAKFKVTTTGGKIFFAKQLIECNARYQSADYYQVFYGEEWLLHEPLPDWRRAGLMTELVSDEGGTDFIYWLALAPDRVLVEPTRFTQHMVDPEILQTKIEIWMTQYGLAPAQCIRHEEGVLPMGRVNSGHTSWPRAGLAAGALRASSGYGFLAMQHWAAATAEQWIRTGRLETVDTYHPSVRFLDALFIKVLINQPRLGGDILSQVARALPDDGFARFMAGEASVKDWLNVIIAMPKIPFIQALCQPRGFINSGGAKKC